MFQFQNLLESYRSQCQYGTGIRRDIQINGTEMKVLYTLAEYRGEDGLSMVRDDYMRL